MSLYASLFARWHCPGRECMHLKKHGIILHKNDKLSVEFKWDIDIIPILSSPTFSVVMRQSATVLDENTGIIHSKHNIYL